MGSLILMGMMRSWVAGVTWWHLITKDEDVVTVMGNTAEKQDKNLAHRDLRHSIVHHKVPRTEINDHPTNVSLGLYKQCSEKKSYPISNKELWTLSQLPDLSQFKDPKPLE